MKTDDIDKYFDLRKRIFKYFGYAEDWRIFSLEDSRDLNWMIVGPKGDPEHGVLVYSNEVFTPEMIKEGNHIYSASIYTQRHLKQWVWRKPEFTMVLGDTQCDMNVYLFLLDSKLECKDADLKQVWADRWGY